MTRNTDYNLEDMGISVFALLYQGLKHWRILLAAAIIGCLVGGGFTYLQAQKGPSELAKAEYELELRQYQDAVDSNTRIAENNEKMLQERTEYLENSIWVNLDSEHVWESTLVYALNLEAEDLSLYSNTAMNPYGQLAGTYMAQLSGKVIPAEDRAALIGTDNPAYWDELVKVTSDGRLVTISCVGESSEYVTRVTSYLAERMAGEAQKAAQTIMPHTCSLYTQSVNEKTDGEMASRRQTISDALAAYRDKAKTARANLKTLLKDGEPKQPGNRIILMALVVGFVFAVLAFVLAVLKCVFGWVVDTEDIVKLYDAPKLGRVRLGRNKKNAVDRLVDRMFFRHSADAESELTGIALYLREKAPSGEVMLCGTAPEEDIRKICDGLAAKTGGAPGVKACMSLAKNMSRLEEAKAGAGVVLVEKLGTSHTRAVVDEADKMVVNGVPVLGWILIDG